jgi:hypothetical protein
VTSKRDSERKPKSSKRPKLKKETLKDLEASEEQAEGARGGRRREGECASLNCCNTGGTCS